ncbi:MAG: methylated-DNA--[Lachnospiraceae bacterium]|nr:methylated-DNA--[protein]-cysteine S-methyltransferase [Lachnospiraceae bacterium]
MYYFTIYDSNVGKLYIVSDAENIVGLWLEGQKYFQAGLKEEPVQNNELPILKEAVKWLEDYFAGKCPEISRLKLKPQGSEFRQIVWQILCEIPYGQTTTYGAISKEAAKRLGKKSMSARAVGGAVGHNPISIIIPCHRVVGSDGSLTGYAGGIDKKMKLLQHEGSFGAIVG